MDELVALLPMRGMRDGCRMSVELRWEFEPHGLASETWENTWSLTVWDIPYHWHSLIGWQRRVEP